MARALSVYWAAEARVWASPDAAWASTVEVAVEIDAAAFEFDETKVVLVLVAVSALAATSAALVFAAASLLLVVDAVENVAAADAMTDDEVWLMVADRLAEFAAAKASEAVPILSSVMPPTDTMLSICELMEPAE